jgi:hypothetical protein
MSRDSKGGKTKKTNVAKQPSHGWHTLENTATFIKRLTGK